MIPDDIFFSEIKLLFNILSKGEDSRQVDTMQKNRKKKLNSTKWWNFYNIIKNFHK